MTDEEFVLSKYPTAVAHQTATGVKIYYVVATCSIALSATFLQPAEAWADAARAIRERAK